MLDSTRSLTQDFCRIHLLPKETVSFINRNNLWGLPLTFFTSQTPEDNPGLFLIDELRPIIDILGKTCYYKRDRGEYLLDEVVEQTRSGTSVFDVLYNQGCGDDVNIEISVLKKTVRQVLYKYGYLDDEIIELCVIFEGDMLIGLYKSLKDGSLIPIEFGDDRAENLVKKYSSLEVRPDTNFHVPAICAYEQDIENDDQSKVKTVSTYQLKSEGDDSEYIDDDSLKKELVKEEVFHLEGSFEGLIVSCRDYLSNEKTDYYYTMSKETVAGQIPEISYESIQVSAASTDTPKIKSVVTKGIVVDEQIPDGCFHPNLKPSLMMRYIPQEETVSVTEPGFEVGTHIEKRAYYYDDSLNLLYKQNVEHVDLNDSDGKKSTRDTTMFYTIPNTKQRQLKSYPVNKQVAHFPLVDEEG